ncbi:MAG: hypothetical protein EPN22_08520 [Nitrospirae bacterium]|nr:MAG: hypothetical protein EPN22_08520 [Nitrospirota bacterium]
MKRSWMILGILILCSCIPQKHPDTPVEPAKLLFIDGVVQSVSGSEATISLKLPDTQRSPDNPISELAQQVVNKCLFIEGINTEVNNIAGTVKEARGGNVVITFAAPAVFAANSSVKLKIPKKTLAIVDFEVIRGREKAAGRVTLESLTSSLIDSGQFTIVERSKLKSVISELQLSLSGLTKETPEKIMGNLITADLILTGTLAEISGVWDINLRLVNVRTGEAVAAVTMKTPLFKPAELRDAGGLNEDFEVSTANSAWGIGYKGKGVFVVKMDKTQGADGSKQSMRMDVDFTGSPKDMLARIDNMKKRDLSMYTGIEFYVKADPQVTGHLRILTSDRDDPNTMDAWVALFETEAEWKLVRVSFDDLFVGRGWVKGGASKFGAKAGKQVIDLSRVEAFSIGAYSENNPPVKGSMWIDKVRFYTD